MVLAQCMLCFVISNLQVLHKRIIHLSEYNYSWKAPNMRLSMTSTHAILKRPGCVVLFPLTPWRWETAVLGNALSTQPELPGIHCCIVDSFLVLEFHLDCQQDVLKASCRYVSFRYGWHRESVLDGSRNHLLKLLMTFKHTSSHPTDSVRPNLIIHTLWGPHCPLLTLKACRNRTEFCISNLQIIQTSVHMSMHLVWQVLLDSSQEHQVWWPQNLT